ncbi:hypothetical protein OAO87_04690, partial [bacterium]|nr:hypothetical protein [bacterium]
GAKREREAQAPAPEIVARGASCKVPAGPLTDAPCGPLVVGQQVRLRDRDLGVRSAAAISQTALSEPVNARRPPAGALSLDQQMLAAHRAGPLNLQIEAGSAENTVGNRFGGSELCMSCMQPHTDANYVATDAEGITTCGDCWDAVLGITVIVECAFPSGAHLCACGKDLRMERWFATEHAQTHSAYCQTCSLDFWGFTNADMVVSASKGDKKACMGQAGGAHLLSSMTTPNDDTSPPAGLSDRGFSIGTVPSLLASCMNLSPWPVRADVAHAMCTRHVPMSTHTYMPSQAALAVKRG